ncbi:MAG TPA: YbaB/EbfC family nucleoid-associated protein [Candidatus Stackebrandtia excrementipullorum]|nr:YbaB/EbfC family nucleoid-associated protein [Candidatus Stackebrandtia excrementipullorum]
MADADRIAELDEQMTRQARQADALQRKLALLRSVATSPCGEVTVEVDSNGVLRGLSLTPEAVDVGAEKLADKIRTTSRAAQEELPQRLKEAVGDP